ncbi:MAG: formate dehydrogenase subunit delta [Rhodoferax sp.]
MNSEHLIRMANQIGIFFESLPDRAEGLEGIATHLRKFWDPRMRQALLAAIDGGHAEGLRPIVRDAVQAHRPQIQPQPADQA